MQRWSAGILGCVILLNGAAAAAVDFSRQQRFDIPPQALSDALVQFSAQAGLQFTAPGASISQSHSGGVSGTYRPDAALRVLLQGTGFTFRIVDEATVAITALPAGAAFQGSARGASSEREAGRSSKDTVQLAQAEQSRAEQPRDPMGAAETTAIAADSKSGSLEEIVVTGSRLSHKASDPQGVRVYDRAHIEASGQTTVSGFLNTLPQVSMRSEESSSRSFAGQTTVQLRGLPVGTTLVLLNGRRLESGGINSTSGTNGFFDLNNIPASAIERIEILPGGSSAIYGSDALAGVVNIILRRNFAGFEASGRYASASGIDDSTFAAAWGKTFERGAFSAVGSYYDRGHLAKSERAITASQDFTRYGGVDRRVSRCNPGNVSSLDGSNLPGQSYSFAAIPAGLQGQPSIHDFDATAGTRNLCSDAQSDLIPGTRRMGVVASANYHLTSATDAFAELVFSRAEQDVTSGQPALISAVVPATNAFNPFGKAVIVNYKFSDPSLAAAVKQRTDYVRPLAGLRGAWANGWQWEIAGWMTQDRDRGDRIRIDSADPARLRAVLASSDPNGTFNLFTAASPASRELIDSVLEVSRSSNEGRIVASSGFVRGSLLNLPSGPVDVVLGGEYDSSKVAAHIPSIAVDFDYTRDHAAAFSEVRVPLIGHAQGSSEAALLALTGAVRFDRSNDFGGNTTMQGGAEWRPTRTLLVRASYAQAYLAPPLLDLQQPTQSYPNYPVIDPLTQQPVGVTLTFGGNPNLQPETGWSRSLGFVWSSASVPALQTSLTYWDIHQNNRVAYLDIQSVVNNAELFPGAVQRGPAAPDGTPGPIESVVGTYRNFGRLQANGFDFDLNYRFDTAIGQLTPTLSVAQTFRYRAALTPGGAPVDRLARANVDGFAPRWKGSASLNWQKDIYSAGVNARYVSRYLDYQDLGPTSRELGNFWIYDFSVRCACGKLVAPNDSYLSNAYLSAGVINAFESEPVYSSYNFGTMGYDPMQYDIRGRTAYLDIGVKW